MAVLLLVRVLQVVGVVLITVRVVLVVRLLLLVRVLVGGGAGIQKRKFRLLVNRVPGVYGGGAVAEGAASHFV